MGRCSKYMTPNESNFQYPMLTILPILSIISVAIITIQPVHAHTFSQNENSLFLTRMNQMHAQLQLVQDLLSTNTTSGNNNVNNIKLAQTHVMETIALLKEKDHVSNFTWNQEIAERNQRVANDLTRGLTDLVAIINQKVLSNDNSKITSANETSSIQNNIYNLSGLLDEAISTRVAKDIVNNSTNEALVLANIGNELFYSYGQALGIPYTNLANMVATMNMSAIDGNNMNMQGKNMIHNMNNMNNMNASSNKMPTTINKVNILNESDYQNAKAYVKQAQEIVSKYLWSPGSTNKITISDNQSQLNKIISQLETTINSKGSFSTVMNLIHLQLHPKLIFNYRIS